MKSGPVLSLLLLLLSCLTSFAQEGVPPCDCTSECESQVTAKQNDLTSEHTKALADLQTKLDASLEQAQDVGATLKEREKRLEELQTSLGAKGESASALEAELAQTKSALAKTQKQLSTAQGELTQTKATLTDAQEQLGTSQNELTLTKATVADTQAQLVASTKDVESLSKELEAVKERELAFQKEAEASMASLHQEIEDLMNHKIKASELEDHVESLQKDLRDHRDELTNTKSSLSKELNDHKQELLLMRQNSLKDQELINHLHEQAVTTYVNTTLIYQDAAVGANKAMVKLAEWYSQAAEASKPHYDQAVGMYKQHAEPHVNAATEQSRKLYDQHLKETVDRDLMPALKPAIDSSSEYLNKAHAMTSESVAMGADTAYKYLKIMADDYDEDENGTRRWFAKQFHWIKENAGEVVTRVLYGFLIFLFLWKFVLPRRKPRGEPADSDGQESTDRGGARRLLKQRGNGNNKRGRKNANGTTKLKSQ